MTNALSPNPIRVAVQSGRPAIGAWAALSDPRAAEIMAEAGLDFLLFDQEHGPGGPADLIPQLMALKGTGTGSIVRIPSNDPVYIKKVLDIGIDAVMVPMVESAEAARAVVAACRYPRRGQGSGGGGRGYAVPLIRASRYGLDLAAYENEANERLFVIVQIESAEGVARVDEIAAVPGIDCLFVGPNDLAGSLGHFGDTGHEEVTAAIATIEGAARRHGKILGAIPRGGVTAADLIAAGYSILPLAADIHLLRDGVRTLLGSTEIGRRY